MKDPVSESGKVMEAVSDSFKDFDLVVTAFCKAVSSRRRERIENTGRPVNHSLSTFLEPFNAAVISRINPIR